MTFRIRVTAPGIETPFGVFGYDDLAPVLLAAVARDGESLAVAAFSAWVNRMPVKTGRMRSAARYRTSSYVERTPDGGASAVCVISFGFADDQWSAWNGLTKLRPALQDWPVRWIVNTLEGGALLWEIG